MSQERLTGTPSEDPPLLHLTVGGAALLVLLIGGTITFGEWGTIQVRLVAAYALGAVALHGAARYTARASLWLRAAAWLCLSAGAVHSGVLLRPEVLLPIAALGLLDLGVHRAEVKDRVVEASDAAKIVAGLASLAGLGLVTALVLLASDVLIMVRLVATVLVAWGLIMTFAMRPLTRSTGTLLGGAGAFSLTFLLLAAPVLPFGPLLAYWAVVASVALAVITDSFSHTGPVVHPEHTRHRQRVEPLPDPVIAGVRDEVRAYLSTGVAARKLSHRIEAALDRDEGGRLLPAMAEAQARGTQPSRADRTLALAQLLDVDDLPDPSEGSS